MSPSKDPINLIALLKLLMEAEPTAKEDLAHWYALSDEAKKILMNQSIDIPHLIWHYLDDADIRLKDSTYASMQNAQIFDLIKKLESDK